MTDSDVEDKHKEDEEKYLLELVGYVWLSVIKCGYVRLASVWVHCACCVGGEREKGGKSCQRHRAKERRKQQSDASQKNSA